MTNYVFNVRTMTCGTAIAVKKEEFLDECVF